MTLERGNHRIYIRAGGYGGKFSHPSGSAYSIVAERNGIRHEHWGLGYEINAPALVAHAMMRLANHLELEVENLESSKRRLEIVTSSATMVSARITGALRDKTKLDSGRLSRGEARRLQQKDCAALWGDLAHRFDLFRLGDESAAINLELFHRAHVVAKEKAFEAKQRGLNDKKGINLIDQLPLNWLAEDVI